MGMRIVHHYIDIRLRPLIEARLTDRTFNNRIGFGQNVAINQVIEDIYEVSKGYTEDAYIIKMDLCGYFPNANQDIVYRQLVDLVQKEYHGDDKDDLLYMIAASVFSYPTRHCERISPLWKWQQIPDSKSLFRKPDGIGGAIGHLIWQNAMNYYLNDIDHWMVDECGLHYSRFVDDMVIVTDNKEAALAMIPLLRERLAVYGCTLHPKKFYCQHYTKGVQFIGAYVKPGRITLKRRTIRNAENAVRQLNRRIGEGHIDTLLQRLNSSLGLFKTRNGHNASLALIKKLNPRWLKYVQFNPHRTCMEATKGHTFNERLRRKFHLKKVKNDTRRKKNAA